MENFRDTQQVTLSFQLDTGQCIHVRKAPDAAERTIQKRKRVRVRLAKIDEFFEKYKLPKLTQKEVN